ncbi:hypothetical protein JQ594_14630 [Bradyrhizobium manausense]|uniref:hypothetical protein n=1 Tax=Bradyrhizobium manausense TaxID=989370 RepID=UPI001BAB25F5|nr:hypothetical protein [Bradyrhizobium manausense]MBR0687163.1 hypothetical protein [Bradyrhizobium manausense]
MTKQPGLDGRHRDVDGKIRAKSSNTRVETLRETYGETFAKGHRSDMKLETLLKREGADSLTDYLRKR